LRLRAQILRARNIGVLFGQTLASFFYFGSRTQHENAADLPNFLQRGKKEGLGEGLSRRGQEVLF
jgi:hypothetical protein